jgi:hypothetical protein
MFLYVVLTPSYAAIDMFQERVLKQGSQKNETAADQAKDDQIKKGISSMYKMATGKQFPGTGK